MLAEDERQAKLYPLSGNLIPGGARVGFLPRGEDAWVRYAFWQPSAQRARGTILLTIGRADFIELYFTAIRKLLAEGFTVFTFDWRGQGGSSRQAEHPELLHQEDFGHYLGDLRAVVRQVLLPEFKAPFYALASDLGASISLLSAPDLCAWCERAALISPISSLPASFPPGLMAALGQSQGVCQSFAQKRGGEPLDPLMQAYCLSHDFLTVRGSTYGWAYALAKACKAMKRDDFPRRGHVPMLLVRGSADEIASKDQAESLAKQTGSSRTLEIGGHGQTALREPSAMDQELGRAILQFFRSA